MFIRSKVIKNKKQFINNLALVVISIYNSSCGDTSDIVSADDKMLQQKITDPKDSSFNSFIHLGKGYFTSIHNSEDTFSSFIKKKIAIDNHNNERDLVIALNEFKAKYNNEYELPKEDLKIKNRALKDAIKLGIYPEEISKLYDESNFKNINTLISNVFMRESELNLLENIYGPNPHQYSKEDDDDRFNSDYTDLERSILEKVRLIISIQSYEIILNIIEKNPSKLDNYYKVTITNCYKEQIKLLSGQTNENAFNMEFISNLSNLNNAKQYIANPHETILGKDNSTSTDKNLKRNKSILEILSQNIELQNGSWNNILGISFSSDKIDNILNNIVSDFDLLSQYLSEGGSENMKNEILTNYDSKIELISKARLLISTTHKEKIDTDVVSDIVGLKWVGQWTKNEPEKQITAEQATELLKLLDWMSASLIYIKYKETMQVPIFGSYSVALMNKNIDFWIKEDCANQLLKVQDNNKKIVYAAMALAPIWVPIGLALGLAVGAAATAGILVASPFYGIYKLLKG